DAKRAELTHQPHQLLGVVETLRVRHPLLGRSTGRVTAKGEHVADAGVGVRADHRTKLRPGMRNAREVCHGQQRRLGRDLAGDPDRSIAGPPARAVRHGHEGGVELLELAERTPEVAFALVGLGWEELEGERPAAGGEALPNRQWFTRVRYSRCAGHAARLASG